GGNIILEAGAGIVLANDISLNTNAGTGVLTVTSDSGTIEQLQASDIDTNGAALTFSAPVMILNGTITTDNGNVTFNNLY
ncbi:MAG: hypothetical protein NZ891_01755, partial [bacterium]|nr:hypothetical protein [bacterium]MDW8163453.1 hypothetical protein [Candidatus Omnitrophota bacterium]